MAPAAKRRKTNAGEASKAVEKEVSPKHSKTQAAELLEPTEPAEPDQVDRSVSDKATKYPGFESWDATLKIRGNNRTSKFDTTTSEFMQSVKIYDPDAFILKPLTVAHGPLKGRHVLMLEPVNIVFRFLDLPAEIRLIVYEMLLKEDKEIVLSTFRARNIPTRAVRVDFHYQSSHPRSTWDKKKHQWSGQIPSAHALLRVNRKIKNETAPVAYGDNAFSFGDLQAMKLFLEAVGDMRQFLRSLTLRDASTRTLLRPTLHMLKDAKKLKSLTLPHSTVCGPEKEPDWGAPGVAVDPQFVEHCRPMMKVLHKAQKSNDEPANVLDAIQVGLKACDAGLCDDEDCSCERWPLVCGGVQYALCSEKRQHTRDVQFAFRKAMAVALRIEQTP